jgi:hypothetical protein
LGIPFVDSKMCYSAPVSLATFLVGTGFSALLYTLGAPFYRLVGLFLGFVSLMQGIEFLLWRHQVCDTTHKALSIAGMILNHLQPLVLIALTYAIYRRNGPALLALAALYTAVIIPYSAQYFRADRLQCTKPAESDCGNPHLIWNWNRLPFADPVYLLFLTTFVLTALLGFGSIRDGAGFAVTAVITYAASHLFYPRPAVGALWCFWVALFPLAMYIHVRLYPLLV